MHTSLNRRRSDLARRFSWLVVAALTTAALIGPSAGAALAVGPDYATVSGYAAGTSDNNHEGTWGDGCTKLDSPGGSTYVLSQGYAKVIVKAGSDQSTDGHANTVFDSPTAGQTVWADSNGTGAFDEGDKTISHIIFCGPTTTTTSSTTTAATTTAATTTGSTTTAATTTAATTTAATTTAATTTGSTTTGSTTTGTTTTVAVLGTTTTSSDGQVLGVTGTPTVTLPPTDTVSLTAPAGTPNGFRFILLGLAALLAMVLLLQPRSVEARAKR